MHLQLTESCPTASETMAWFTDACGRHVPKGEMKGKDESILLACWLHVTEHLP